MVWTDERVETVKRMWADGYSAGLIAMELGTSRSAVVGKVDRLNLPKRKSTQCRVLDYEARRQAGLKSVQTREARNPVKAKPKQPKKRPPTIRALLGTEPLSTTPLTDSEIPQEQRRSLLELTSNTCRWPVGDPQSPDFFFCGAKPLAAHPYCAAHSRRAYNIGGSNARR